MPKNKTQKHLFALYYDNLFDKAPLYVGALLKIIDSTIIHRINNVLRLRTAEDVILFDSNNHVLATIATIGKHIELIIKEVQQNKKIEPFITLCLPVLKRDDLELAIPLAVQVGVSAIQLITTQRSHMTRGKYEVNRLHRLAIAASEQSKQFIVPEILEPISLETALHKYHASNIIICTVDGQPFAQCMTSLKKDIPITVFIGPEADFSENEFDLFKQYSALPMKLTPTVLRASTAAALSIGIMRSYYL